MTREEHLKFCKFCFNRKINMQKGLVCNLTGEIADFDNSCASYEIDDIETKRLETKVNDEMETSSDSVFFGSWQSALLLSAFGFTRAEKV